MEFFASPYEQHPLYSFPGLVHFKAVSRRGGRERRIQRVAAALVIFFVVFRFFPRFYGDFPSFLSEAGDAGGVGGGGGCLYSPRVAFNTRECYPIGWYSAERRGKTGDKREARLKHAQRGLEINGSRSKERRNEIIRRV